MACTNDFCIASDCDGEEHIDATGHTWFEPPGWRYNPATGQVEPPR